MHGLEGKTLKLPPIYWHTCEHSLRRQRGSGQTPIREALSPCQSLAFLWPHPRCPGMRRCLQPMSGTQHGLDQSQSLGSGIEVSAVRLDCVRMIINNESIPSSKTPLSCSAHTFLQGNTTTGQPLILNHEIRMYQHAIGHGSCIVLYLLPSPRSERYQIGKEILFE
jgi:hypothetical protein